ncbi:hypothetical protein EVAR_102628_1 [Eumeta japonica]|uniref:Uncharacterized protein n=1 Tax=Eumeta variegata TaxID=151549 RepID=A0A4C1TUT3_EUMVA|nr:hypothetical protein EVAR_102628_1 [Eumeta japonica]
MEGSTTITFDNLIRTKLETLELGKHQNRRAFMKRVTAIGETKDRTMCTWESSEIEHRDRDGNKNRKPNLGRNRFAAYDLQPYPSAGVRVGVKADSAAGGGVATGPTQKGRNLLCPYGQKTFLQTVSSLQQGVKESCQQRGCTSTAAPDRVTNKLPAYLSTSVLWPSGREPVILDPVQRTALALWFFWLSTGAFEQRHASGPFFCVLLRIVRGDRGVAAENMRSYRAIQKPPAAMIERGESRYTEGRVVQCSGRECSASRYSGNL